MAVRGESEFLNLPFQEKLEFLYGLPARQKRDLILSAPEAERLVQSFSPETLFYTLKEIGSADAGDLLSLAMPEQVKSLFDLDCWDKDRPNLRSHARMDRGDGRRRTAQARRRADGARHGDWCRCCCAATSRCIASMIRVIAGDAPANRFAQFDENYLIEFIRHDAISQHISDFLEEAFERDYNYFAGLMEEIYWGVEAELEEEAYQFRRARLNDRGFPDYLRGAKRFRVPQARAVPDDSRRLRTAEPRRPARRHRSDRARDGAGDCRRRRLAVQHRADRGFRARKANASSAARWRWSATRCWSRARSISATSKRCASRSR